MKTVLFLFTQDYTLIKPQATYEDYHRSPRVLNTAALRQPTPAGLGPPTEIFVSNTSVIRENKHQDPQRSQMFQERLGGKNNRVCGAPCGENTFRPDDAPASRSGSQPSPRTRDAIWRGSEALRIICTSQHCPPTPPKALEPPCPDGRFISWSS